MALKKAIYVVLNNNSASKYALCHDSGLALIFEKRKDAAAAAKERNKKVRGWVRVQKMWVRG